MRLLICFTVYVLLLLAASILIQDKTLGLTGLLLVYGDRFIIILCIAILTSLGIRK